MTLAYRLEAVAVRVALGALRALRPAAASNLGGAVARLVGPMLPVSRVADTNLKLALPALDAVGRRRVVRGAWESLGRTVGELPHVGVLGRTASGPGWDIEGEAIMQAVAERDGPVIFFSAHIGNWEMLPRVCAAHGFTLAGLYRAPTNPYVGAVLARLRQQGPDAETPMFAKGTMGARLALAHLRTGGALGIMMDQKMNDGVQATLFGHPAMTATALAALALRFRCPVIPGYAERTGPARFHLVCEPPLALPDSGDRGADILALTQAVNDCLERWIRRRPDSWLWMHRRWPKEFYV